MALNPDVGCASAALRSQAVATRFGVDGATLFPRVARPLQPWAGGRNPVGIL